MDDSYQTLLSASIMLEHCLMNWPDTIPHDMQPMIEQFRQAVAIAKAPPSGGEPAGVRAPDAAT